MALNGMGAAEAGGASGNRGLSSPPAHWPATPHQLRLACWKPAAPVAAGAAGGEAEAANAVGNRLLFLWLTEAPAQRQQRHFMLSHVTLGAVGTSGGAAETAAEPPAVPPGGRGVDCAPAEARYQAMAIQNSRSSRRRMSGGWGGGGLREVLSTKMLALRQPRQTCWCPTVLRAGKAV